MINIIYGPNVFIRFEANELTDPIAVTGNDGKKYNVIPSDQFK